MDRLQGACEAFPQASFFPVTLLAEKQAGSSQTEDRDSAHTSTRVNHQMNACDFISEADNAQ